MHPQSGECVIVVASPEHTRRVAQHRAHCGHLPASRMPPAAYGDPSSTLLSGIIDDLCHVVESARVIRHPRFPDETTVDRHIIVRVLVCRQSPRPVSIVMILGAENSSTTSPVACACAHVAHIGRRGPAVRRAAGALAVVSQPCSRPWAERELS